GLLGAIGAQPRQILEIFLTEAVLLAVAGAAAGLMMGFAIVRVFIALYPTFPAAPPIWAIAAAVVVAVVVGTLFGVLPARRASAVDPVAALAGRVP
ncbi:MAG: FtsX-like permease family protein, partial [Myxococcota bacterium]